MFKPLPFFIGIRYTRAKRRNHFISFISLMSMIGLALGVCTLIIVMSVMNGFGKELRDRILGMVPHASIQSMHGGLNNWQSILQKSLSFKGIQAAAPFIDGQGMLTNNQSVQGLMFYGIEPKYEKNVSILNQHIIKGSLNNLQAQKFGIILGDILAQLLGVTVGDKVTLVLPKANVNIAGIFPRMKRFTVVGIFSIGANLDSSLAYIHIKDAAKLLNIPEGASAVRLKMDDLFQAPFIAWQFTLSLKKKQYRVDDWTRTQGQLFQAVKMEKNMVGLLLTLIITIAAFNIVSTLIMVVTDKQSDIAILRTLGASSKMVMSIFMIQGSLIGAIGTFFGIIFGILGSWNVTSVISWIETTFNTHFLNPDIYFVSYLPSDLHWQDVLVISVISLSMSFLATLYPAWRASKTQPAEALRYE